MPEQCEAASENGRKRKIRLEDVSYIYSPKTAYAMQALEHVSWIFMRGSLLGLSGIPDRESPTLIQLAERFDSGIIRKDSV